MFYKTLCRNKAVLCVGCLASKLVLSPALRKKFVDLVFQRSFKPKWLLEGGNQMFRRGMSSSNTVDHFNF